MPYEIDEAKIKKDGTLDLAKPPMRQLGHAEFPKVVYFHPTKPFKKVFEPVPGQPPLERTAPTEHKARVVADKHELAKALKEGWQEKAYLPQAVPVQVDDEYQ